MLQKKQCIIIGLGLLMFIVNAYSVTLVDDFNSYTNGPLHGQGTAGDGWAGPWDGLGDADLYVYDGTVGYDHDGTGRTARKVRVFSEHIALTSGAPTIWLSYDAKSDYSGSFNAAFGITMGGVYPDSTYLPQNLFGRVAGSEYWSNWVRQSNPYYDFSTATIPDNEWCTVWIELTPTGSGTADYRMWINPIVTLDPDDPGQVAPILDSTLQIDHDYFTYVGLATSGGTGCTNSDRFDNLRVSTDSAPVVPEPATLGIMGIASLIMVYHKRK